MHVQQRSYAHSRRDHQDLWDKFWKDKHGRVVIFQVPNILLIGWAVLTVVSLFVPRGQTQETVWWLSVALLGVWSLLEISKGVNYFRKSLGVAVLLLVVASIFGVGR
jgi:hypothetical protein